MRGRRRRRPGQAGGGLDHEGEIEAAQFQVERALRRERPLRLVEGHGDQPAVGLAEHDAAERVRRHDEGRALDRQAFDRHAVQERRAHAGPVVRLGPVEPLQDGLAEFAFAHPTPRPVAAVEQERRAAGAADPPDAFGDHIAPGLGRFDGDRLPDPAEKMATDRCGEMVAHRRSPPVGLVAHRLFEERPGQAATAMRHADTEPKRLVPRHPLDGREQRDRRTSGLLGTSAGRGGLGYGAQAVLVDRCAEDRVHVAPTDRAGDQLAAHAHDLAGPCDPVVGEAVRPREPAAQGGERLVGWELLRRVGDLREERRHLVVRLRRRRKAERRRLQGPGRRGAHHLHDHEKRRDGRGELFAPCSAPGGEIGTTGHHGRSAKPADAAETPQRQARPLAIRDRGVGDGGQQSADVEGIGRRMPVTLGLLVVEFAKDKIAQQFCGGAVRPRLQRPLDQDRGQPDLLVGPGCGDGSVEHGARVERSIGDPSRDRRLRVLPLGPLKHAYRNAPRIEMEPATPAKVVRERLRPAQQQVQRSPSAQEVADRRGLRDQIGRGPEVVDQRWLVFLAQGPLRGLRNVFPRAGHAILEHGFPSGGKVTPRLVVPVWRRSGRDARCACNFAHRSCGDLGPAIEQAIGKVGKHRVGRHQRSRGHRCAGLIADPDGETNDVREGAFRARQARCRLFEQRA
ncbi:hypothetical protein [Elioraea sp.]|uniref:hypothetical protein n=1 Tax=Elioraea sp. TaxID=2185103 RepID=UPI0038CFC709